VECDPQEKVLDLGCEDGSLFRDPIDTKRIVGRGVEIAEPKVLAGVAVRQGDLHEESRDYPEKSWDTVILSYGPPYLSDPAFIVSNMRISRRFCAAHEVRIAATTGLQGRAARPRSL
jgi:hypothetical protein